MQISTKDNNPYLLIDGTDRPQRDANGNPIANPNYGQVTTVTVPAPPTFPLLLSSTAFNKYAAGRLAGGGVNGMARFMEIMQAGRDAGGAAAFCVNQYDKALTFEKSEVLAFGNVLKGAGCMTQDEVDGILDDWPEG